MWTRLYRDLKKRDVSLEIVRQGKDKDAGIH